jgi:uncharacterized peroxidase-related enzyme
VFLDVVEAGHDRVTATFLRFVELVGRAKLPDVIKTVSYRHRYFGTPFTDLVQRVMRGPSFWTIADRELFAARISKSNTCPFCVSSHQPVAAAYAGKDVIDAAMESPQDAPLRPETKAVLAFLDKMSADPASIDAADVRAVKGTGVSREALEDAVWIATLFHVINRVLNSLGAQAMEPEQQQRAVRFIKLFGYRNAPIVRLLSRAG